MLALTVPLVSSLLLAPPLDPAAAAAALDGIRAAAPSERAAAIEAALALGDDPAAWRAALAAHAPRPSTDLEAGWSLFEAVDEEGVARPYRLFVPESVLADATPCPLLVHMHGAVARPDFTTDVGRMGYGEMLWPEPAEEHRFAVAFPLGKTGVEWWTEAGVRNVHAVLRDAKRRLHVDDRRVIGTGFSDGASGCYHLAMTRRDAFAGFIPMNGHPAVAASASGLQLYPRNMARTPMVACMTEDDSLYPARTVLPHLTAALEAGGGLHLVSYPSGGHQPAYFGEQRGLLMRFITETERDTWPTTVEWTTSRPEEGRRAWLTVTALGATTSDAAPPEPAQVMTRPGRVRLGVSVDRSVTDRVVVDSVTEGGLAASVGVEAGDVLLALNGAGVAGVRDLRAALSRVTYGDTVELAAERDGAPLVLVGAVPSFAPEPIYRRTDAAGWVRAAVAPGRVSITSAGVRAVRLELSADLAGEAPAVTWNGVEVAAATPTLLSARGRLERFARDADPDALPDLVLEVEAPTERS